MRYPISGPAVASPDAASGTCSPILRRPSLRPSVPPSLRPFVSVMVFVVLTVSPSNALVGRSARVSTLEAKRGLPSVPSPARRAITATVAVIVVLFH